MRGLAGLLMAACLLSAAAACAASPTVVWYRFEDGQVGEVVPGNTRVKDSGPNGLDGWTPYDCHARRVPGIAPGSKQAWDISGLSDWFLVPDDPRLAIEGSLTLEAWVKLRAYQSTAVSNFIIFRGDETPGWDAYCLALTPAGDLMFHIEGPGHRQGDPPPTVKCRFARFGVPVHVAGVFDAQKGSLGLYVNGDLMASMTTTVRPRVHLNPAMAPGLGVGGYHGGGRASFAINGVIDEVRVSSAPLESSALLCSLPGLSQTTPHESTSEPPAVPSGPQAALQWMGTRGFEHDGVEPNRGRPGTRFLFAVRCTPQGYADPVIRLELQRDGQRLELTVMDRARNLPGDKAMVYRARIELGPGQWEYRLVGNMIEGAPTQWHPGPVVQ